MIFSGRPPAAQVVQQVIGRLRLRQRLQDRPHRQALSERGQLRPRQRVQQPPLSYQDHLKGPTLPAFQIGQKPQLLQQVGSQVLRLVHQQQRRSALAAVGQQIVRQGQAQLLFGASLVRQREFVEDGLEKGNAIGQVAVGQEGARTSPTRCNRQWHRRVLPRPGSPLSNSSPSSSDRPWSRRASASSWPVAG